jgi:hypothetical protein
MIARVWHGVVPGAKADAYGRYLADSDRGIPDYGSTPGNRGATLLRRDEGDLVHFTLISLWESRAAIVAYAGAEIDKAQYFPFDLECLVDLEPHVLHHEVVAAAGVFPDRAATEASWEVVSSSGRERAAWLARPVEDPGSAEALTCDVVLIGRFFGASLDAAPPGPSPDFGLEMRGLAVRIATLQRLHAHLRSWLDLPLAEQRRTRLAFDCEMGGLFDQDVRLILGERADTLSAGHPVATVKFVVGRMSGEMSFVTDQTCLAALCAGLAKVLGRSM